MDSGQLDVCIQPTWLDVKYEAGAQKAVFPVTQGHPLQSLLFVPHISATSIICYVSDSDEAILMRYVII